MSVTSTSYLRRCGRPTAGGRPCRNLVPADGERCHVHRPRGPQRPAVHVPGCRVDSDGWGVLVEAVCLGVSVLEHWVCVGCGVHSYWLGEVDC